MLKTSINRTKKIANIVIRDMSDPYYQGVAAELAFFFLLSLFPLMILLGQISGLFSISLERLIEFLSEYMPHELSNQILPYLSLPNTGGFSIFFLFFSIWSASKGFYALIQISDYAHAIEKTMFKRAMCRVKSIFLTFVSLFVILFSLFVLIFGERIMNLILTILAISTEYFFINNLVLLLRWPLSLSLYFFVIAFIYISVPTKRPRIKSIIPGTIFATLGVVLSSFIFMFYVNNFANLGALYGALSNAVALLFWFYIIGYIIVIGMQVNIAYEPK